MTLSIPSALTKAGYNVQEVNDPLPQQKVQRLMCKISLKVGIVGCAVSTPTDVGRSGSRSNITSNSSNGGSTMHQQFRPASKIYSDTTISKMDRVAASLVSLCQDTSNSKNVTELPLILVIAAMEEAGLSKEEATDSRHQIYVKIKTNLMKLLLLTS